MTGHSLTIPETCTQILTMKRDVSIQMKHIFQTNYSQSYNNLKKKHNFKSLFLNFIIYYEFQSVLIPRFVVSL